MKRGVVLDETDVHIKWSNEASLLQEYKRDASKHAFTVACSRTTPHVSGSAAFIPYAERSLLPRVVSLNSMLPKAVKNVAYRGK